MQIGNLSGITDDVKENWRDYVGAVAEVTAMEVMDTEGLRHPKLNRFREDMPARDCTWEKIYGKEIKK